MNNYLNLPNIPSNLMGNVFLGCRGQGDCRSLTGKVLLTVIMVDDSESSWNVLAISDYKKKQAAATAKLQAEAKRYGVSLNIGMHYLRSRIEGTFSIQDFSGWVSKALRGAGLPQEEEVIPMLRRNAGVKEAAIIFAVNRPGRAFAIARNIQKAFEYTIVYGEDADYRHELLHLFGAKDFYYPADVKKIAEKYFSDSIMMRTYGDVKVDELTAYLVGWTDKVSDKIQRFLTETSWVTQQYINDACKSETKTGFGTILYGKAVYTGDLAAGLPHGKGKLVWPSGNTYEGEWKNGAVHGRGVMTWKEIKNTYSGEWKNWKRHGYGTYTYADGRTLSGRWEEDTYKG